MNTLLYTPQSFFPVSHLSGYIMLILGMEKILILMLPNLFSNNYVRCTFKESFLYLPPSNDIYVLLFCIYLIFGLKIGLDLFNSFSHLII